LWPASLIELSKLSRYHPFVQLCQKAENDAYRHADVVVSMLPHVAEHMQQHGLDLKRLYIVQNGLSEKEWQGPFEALPLELTTRLTKHKQAGLHVVGYAGSHGLPNALDVLLDAARKLRDEPIVFVLVGQGTERARLQARAKREQLSRIEFFDPIAKTQIPSLLALFDVAYLGWQRQPLYRFGISPNKLIDYMMAACPILHSVEAANDLVCMANCGLSVPPESSSAVANGLLQLLALTKNERQTMGQRGKAYVLAHHTYSVLAAQFIQAIDQAINQTHESNH
jgi:hypothetical protein